MTTKQDICGSPSCDWCLRAVERHNTTCSDACREALRESKRKAVTE